MFSLRPLRELRARPVYPAVLVELEVDLECNSEFCGVAGLTAITPVGVQAGKVQAQRAVALSSPRLTAYAGIELVSAPITATDTSM